MKLFVVLGYWNYEGFDEPIGVFSSRGAAEECLKHAYNGYDGKEIREYDLDQIPPPRS